MIPGRPRLHPRCHVVRVAGALALRRGPRVLQMEDPERIDLAGRVFRHLDGRPLEALMAAFPAGEKLQVLALLGHLAQEGLLVESSDGDAEPLPPEPELPRATRDLAVGVAGRRRIAHDLVTRLRQAGLRSAGYGGREPRMEGDRPFWILALDVPDLAAVLEWNRQAVAGGRSFVAGFPLGEELFVGPVIVQGRPPCLRCLVLRLLGLARHIPVERALQAQLARGAWRREALPGSTASWLAAQVAQVALQAIEHGAAEPEVRVTDRGTGVTTRHRLAAHPACEICGQGAPLAAQEVSARWQTWREERSEPPVRGSLAGLAGERLGLVTEARRGGPDRGGLFVATARFATFHPERVHRHQGNLACGLAGDAGTAQEIAQIEGLERYCLGATMAPARIATCDALGAAAILPSDLPLHSERQSRQPGFPYAVFRRDLPLTWVWGYSLSREQPVLLPEEVASALLPRASLYAETSSGVAAHWSRERALLSAVLELVERDAFMIHWLLRHPPPRLDGDELGSPGNDVIAGIRSAGYDVELVDLSLDLRLPVVAAFGLRDDGQKPALLVGAGCALEPRAAARKALAELGGAVFSWVDRPWRPAPPMQPDEVCRLEDHGAAYAHPLWRDRAAFLWSAEETRRLDEMPRLPAGEEAVSPLAALVEELRRHHLELIAVDLTTPDVSSSGLHVVRAVVPGLQPIGFGPFGLRLGGRRLYGLAERLGRACSESELNADPHCFP